MKRSKTYENKLKLMKPFILLATVIVFIANHFTINKLFAWEFDGSCISVDVRLDNNFERRKKKIQLQSKFKFSSVSES